MSDSWLRVLVLVLIFAAVLLAVEAIVGWIASSRAEGRAINLRLQMIGRGISRSETMNLLRRRASLLPEGMPTWLSRPAAKLEQTLAMAGVTLPTPQLMLILLLSPVVLLTIIIFAALTSGMRFGFGQFLMLATFAGLIGLALPLMVLSTLANRRRKKMQDQFPVALDVFVRGLRAGHPIAAALDLLTIEMPDPIGSEFGLVVDEVTYGAELRDSLQAMADRWDLDDIRMFVVSLSVQSETGGNLAEILENLSRVIRERASMMLKVRALSSEGRMTAVMLTALPVLAFTALFTFSPSFYLDVAGDPAFVPAFVGLLLLYFVGFVTIRRMVNLKV